MKEIRYTLLSDGPTDRALLPILEWVLRDIGVTLPLVAQWADPLRFPERSRKLSDRVLWTLELYPCDLLFIHRDAEREDYDLRKSQIISDIEILNTSNTPYICVIPVRMTEAWLVFHEGSIRRASSNPNGRVRLELPSKNRIESIPDPKELLYNFLKQASELTGRRLSAFNERYAASLVADFISDFSSLKGLPAFDQLYNDTKKFVTEQNWLP
jgi:hypothetical protein